MYVYYPQITEEGIRFSGDGVMSYKWFWVVTGCWKWNPDPLEVEPMPLMSELLSSLYCHPHFTNEETSAHPRQVISPVLTVRKHLSWNPSPLQLPLCQTVTGCKPFSHWLDYEDQLTEEKCNSEGRNMGSFSPDSVGPLSNISVTVVGLIWFPGTKLP